MKNQHRMTKEADVFMQMFISENEGKDFFVCRTLFLILHVRIL